MNQTRVRAVLIGVHGEGHPVDEFVVRIRTVLDLDPVGVGDRRAQGHQSEALAHGRRGQRQGHADLRNTCNYKMDLCRNNSKQKCISYLYTQTSDVFAHFELLWFLINRVTLEKEQ